MYTSHGYPMRPHGRPREVAGATGKRTTSHVTQHLSPHARVRAPNAEF